MYNRYEAVNYKRRPELKWTDILKKISLIEDPQLGVASVLNQIEKEGNKLTKWELCRVVKELRKFNKFNLALEAVSVFLTLLVEQGGVVRTKDDCDNDRSLMIYNLARHLSGWDCVAFHQVQWKQV